MSKTLYLECYSGISGDMTAAALLDLGADEAGLRNVLKTLPVDGFAIKIGRVSKSGIDCCDFDVLLDADHENHDHDMAYLHGHEHDMTGHHTHEESHDHGEHHHDHDHEHHHDHDHHHHSHHEHRNLSDITRILQGSGLTENAKGIALRIFDVLAKAEAKAHNKPVDQVHFHEVGAVDSIVDIVTVAFCLDDLGISEVIVPLLCEGQGTIRCQHGILPIPVPAVANIAADAGLPLKVTNVRGELVTPTGAAIVAATMTSSKLPPAYKIQKIGLGAGKRAYECPGFLRAMLIEDTDKEDVPKDTIIKLESNIDDCSGENLGYVMDLLFAAGARDVHFLPVYMKKNRPAWLLCVICSKEDVGRMEEIIFKETTTIGIRRTEMERSVLKREQILVDTLLGQAEVKVCDLDGSKRFYPEYASVEKLCRQHGKSYGEVYGIIRQACEDR